MGGPLQGGGKDTKGSSVQLSQGPYYGHNKNKFTHRPCQPPVIVLPVIFSQNLFFIYYPLLRWDLYIFCSHTSTSFTA